MSTPGQSVLQYRYLLLSCGIIFLSWAAIQTFILYWYNISLSHSVVDSIMSALVITISCYVIANALHYYQPGKEKFVYILAWVLSLTIFSIAVIRYGIRWTLPADYRIFVDYSLPLRFFAAFLLIGWMAIMKVLWNIQSNNSDYEKRKTDAEKMAREAELYNLRQQLQPHFLFNSLNSVIALIGKKPQEARAMVFQLSDFLRGTLHKDDQSLLSINEELDHLRLYLAIEKVRFGHRLVVDFHVDSSSDQCQVPPMIIQPLLENAIKYGLYDITDDVHIEINVSKVENILKIEIKNPFDSETQTTHKRSGFGLRSIERRLFLIYGRTDLLQTHTSSQTFTATLLIPQVS